MSDCTEHTCPQHGERNRLLAENAQLVETIREMERSFSERLGFGDGRTEPAATLEQMVDPIEQAFSDAHEHAECPVVCEPCGERLAATICEHCHGSGCGPGTAFGAFSECEWCAGVGRVHTGCVEQSYADLAAAAEQAERQVREIREGIAEVEARCVKAEDELREVQAERERHNCTNDARRLAGKREGVALVRDYLRALSGMSGPTTPDALHDACDHEHDYCAVSFTRPTTEGASE